MNLFQNLHESDTEDEEDVVDVGRGTGAVIYVDPLGHLVDPPGWDDVPPCGTLVMTWEAYDKVYHRDLPGRTVVVGGKDRWSEDCAHVRHPEELWHHLPAHGSTTTLLVTHPVLLDVALAADSPVDTVEVLVTPDGGGLGPQGHTPVDLGGLVTVSRSLGAAGFTKVDAFTWSRKNK
jgi:hypothetical protein